MTMNSFTEQQKQELWNRAEELARAKVSRMWRDPENHELDRMRAAERLYSEMVYRTPSQAK